MDREGQEEFVVLWGLAQVFERVLLLVGWSCLMGGVRKFVDQVMQRRNYLSHWCCCTLKRPGVSGLKTVPQPIFFWEVQVVGVYIWLAFGGGQDSNSILSSVPSSVGDGRRASSSESPSFFIPGAGVAQNGQIFHCSSINWLQWWQVFFRRV